LVTFGDYKISGRGLGVLAVVLHLLQTAAALDLYVAPNGSDDATGLTPAAALQTVHKARDVVRAAIAGGMREHVRINLLGGIHVLGAPLVLNEADSGRDGYSVTWRNHPGHTPVVSGGIHVPAGAWTKTTVNGRAAWSATVDGLPDGSRVLIVNGQRRPRARSRLIVPRGYDAEGTAGLLFDAADVGTFRSVDGLELHHTDAWRHCIAPVESIEFMGNGLCAIRSPVIGMANNMSSSGINLYQPAWLEHAVELMDEPGEWVFDRGRRTLYYLPMPGESIGEIDAVLPRLPRLVEVRGAGLSEKVSDIAVEGIAFAYGGWNDVNNTGWLAQGAGYVCSRNDKAGGVSYPHVFVSCAHNITFRECTFAHMGGAGLCLGNGVSTSSVTGCVFKDISASGLFLGAAVGGEHVEGPEEIPRAVLIANNLLYRTGQEFYETAAIVSGLGLNCRVTHNHIQDLPHMGIVIRRFEPCPPDSAGGSGDWLVAHNRVENVMKRLSDGGGIYTMQMSSDDCTRSTMVSNYVTVSHAEPGGFYFDWNCGFWNVSDNVVDRTPHYWLMGQGHNTTIGDNFTDNARMKAARRNRYHWLVTNTTVDVTAEWSRYPVAAATVACAGLERGCRHLLEHVSAGPVTNSAPAVRARAAKSRISLLETVRLDASVVDDGAPWGVTKIAWRTISGPGDATFFGYRHTLLNPEVAFSEPGDYVVRLEVSDGRLAGHCDVEISVVPVALSDNLALARRATESVAGERVVPGNAVDGDPDTFWSPGSPGRGWLQVDLGAAVPVRLIQLIECAKETGGTERFIVKGSNDPSFVRFDVLGRQGPDAFESKLPDRQAVWSLPVTTGGSYRHIRWEKTMGSNGLVTELRVFALEK